MRGGQARAPSGAGGVLPDPAGSPEPSRRRFSFRRVLGFVFVLLAFGFLLAYVSRDLAEVRSYDWRVRPWLLLLSVLLNIGGLMLGVWSWKVLLGLLGHPVSARGLARVWFVSGLGRYIPGKIWQFVGAAQLGTTAGLPARVTITSLAAHTFLFLVGALLTAVYLAPLHDIGLGLLATVLRVVAPLVLVLVHPALLRRVFVLLGRLARRDIGTWSGSWTGALVVVLLATVAWAITGAALFLFVWSLVPIPLAAAPAVVGINALAFVAGFLVFVAPAGLGAKEGALAALLSLYLPISVAALVAVAARLWTVAAEVLPALALLRAAPLGGASRADRAP